MSKQQAVQMRNGNTSRNTANGLFRQDTLGPHLCVQREAVSPEAEENAPSLVREALHSPGQALDPETRSFMEPRFGFDLSGVRVHSDEQAARSARAINANAYTAGPHVVFGTGKYSPHNAGAQLLMAHELAHVVQQAAGSVAGVPAGNNIKVSNPADRFEGEARSEANRVVFGDQELSRPSHTLPYRATGPDSDQFCVQRDVGTVAGVIGAVIGAAGLGIAIWQLLVAKHPPANASPTGGLTLNHAQFNTLDRQARGSTDESMSSAQPITKKILHLSAPGEKGKPDDAMIGLTMRTDQHNIIEAFTQEETIKGYTGGSEGATATVSFTATQSQPLQQAHASGADESEEAPVTSPAQQSPAPAKTGGKKKSKKASAPTPPEKPHKGTNVTVAEEILRFQGINSRGEQLERFKGALKIRADGKIEPINAECKITQSQGNSAGMITSAVEPYVSFGFSPMAEPVAVEEQPGSPTPQKAGGGDGPNPRP